MCCVVFRRWCCFVLMNDSLRWRQFAVVHMEENRTSSVHRVIIQFIIITWWYKSSVGRGDRTLLINNHVGFNLKIRSLINNRSIISWLLDHILFWWLLASRTWQQAAIWRHHDHASDTNNWGKVDQNRSLLVLAHDWRDRSASLDVFKSDRTVVLTLTWRPSCWFVS